jgi:hypothetical protein
LLDGQAVGVTPFVMTDTKIVGSTTQVRLEYPGYEPLNAVIARNEEFSVAACIGGIFVLVPLLWIMGYKPLHAYELRPAGTGTADPWGGGAPPAAGPYQQAPADPQAPYPQAPYPQQPKAPRPPQPYTKPSRGP